MSGDKSPLAKKSEPGKASPASSQQRTAKTDEKKKTSKPAKKPAGKKSDTSSVQVTFGKVQLDVLDSLRGSTSRHDYVQGLVFRHLEAANPVASFQPEDDLPGNERAVNAPNFRT